MAYAVTAITASHDKEHRFRTEIALMGDESIPIG